jgi:hypothetical protein
MIFTTSNALSVGWVEWSALLRIMLMFFTKPVPYGSCNQDVKRSIYGNDKKRFGVVLFGLL